MKILIRGNNTGIVARVLTKNKEWVSASSRSGALVFVGIRQELASGIVSVAPQMSPPLAPPEYFFSVSI